MRAAWWIALVLMLSWAAPPRQAEAKEAKEPALDPSRVGRLMLPLHKDSRKRAKRVEAVERGLRWLAAHQSPSGLWEAKEALGWCDGKRVPPGERADGAGDPHHDVAVTALALCAFQGAGYTHKSANPYRDVVGRGLRALILAQEGGCFGKTPTPRYVYNHWLATLAVAEAHRMTRDRELAVPLRQAAEVIGRMRNPYFGYRYDRRRNDNGTAETLFAIQAVHALHQAKLRAERAGGWAPWEHDDGAYDSFKWWLEKMTDPDYGRVGNTERGKVWRPKDLEDRFPHEKSEMLTAGRIWLLKQVMPASKIDETDEKGAELILALPPTGNTRDGSIDMLYWWFGAQALHALGGKYEREWQKAIDQVFVGSQITSGKLCAALGSWDPHGVWGKIGGRVYATAVMCLALLAPARYPRIEKPAKWARTTAPKLGSFLANKSTPAWRREEGLRVLADAGGSEAARALSVLVKHDDASVRRGAVKIAAGLGDTGRSLASTLRTRLAKDSDPAVRALAAFALHQIGSKRGSVLEALQAALADTDPLVRVRAAAALRALGGDAAAAKAVLEREAEADTPARGPALAALGRAPEVPLWLPKKGEKWSLRIEDVTELDITRAGKSGTTRRRNELKLRFLVEAVSDASGPLDQVRLTLDDFSLKTTLGKADGTAKEIIVQLLDFGGGRRTAMLIADGEPGGSMDAIAKALLVPWYEFSVLPSLTIGTGRIKQHPLAGLSATGKSEKLIKLLLESTLDPRELMTRVGAVLQALPRSTPPSAKGTEAELTLLGLRLHGAAPVTCAPVEEKGERVVRRRHQVRYAVDTKEFDRAMRTMLANAFRAELGVDDVGRVMQLLHFEVGAAGPVESLSEAWFDPTTGRLLRARNWHDLRLTVDGSLEFLLEQFADQKTKMTFEVSGRTDATLKPYEPRVQETFGVGGGGEDK